MAARTEDLASSHTFACRATIVYLGVFGSMVGFSHCYLRDQALEASKVGCSHPDHRRYLAAFLSATPANGEAVLTAGLALVPR